MDIDFSSTIIGIVVLSFFFVPFVYFEGARKRKAHKFGVQFKKTAESFGLNLSVSDSWQDSRAIGLDEARRALIFLKHKGGKDDAVVIQLADIQNCAVIKAEELVKLAKDQITVVRKAELKLTSGKKAQDTFRLIFYDEADGDAFGNQLMLAEKWASLIRKNI